MTNDDSGQRRLGRRRFIKSSGVAAGIGGLAGCSDAGGEGNTPSGSSVGSTDGDLAGESVQLITELGTPAFKKYWDDLASKFKEETGGQLNVEFVGQGASMRSRITQLVQAGSPPDIAHTPLNFAATFAAEGALADHSEVIDVWRDYHGDFSAGRLQIDGADRIIPMFANVWTLWYRSDLIDTRPDSWEKQLQVAREMDEGQGGMRGIMMHNNSEMEMAFYRTLSNAWSNGTQICDRVDGEVQVVVDQEPHLSKWKEVFEYDKELSQYSNDNTGIQYDAYINAIANEEAYMAPYVGARPKNALSSDLDFAESVRPVLYPKPSGGEHMSWGNTGGYAVYDTDNTEAALEFMKFWGKPENLLPIYGIEGERIHMAPVQTEMADTDLFQSEVIDPLPDFWSYEDDIKPYFESIGNSTDLALETEPPNPNTSAIRSNVELSKIAYDININGADIESRIKSGAQTMRQQL